VGASHADNLAFYEEFGAVSRDEILRLLPPGWSFEGRRVLDFGCGAGRTLRHFLAEAELGEIYGCDIDAESVEWLSENLCPPLRVFRNDELPPLPFADGTIDAVWAISVFTHLAENADAWLAELKRVLAPGGYLLATFNGTGTVAAITEAAGVDWDERDGRRVLLPDNPWEAGGPAVLLAPWWVKEHWGRLFEIVTLEEAGFAERFWRGRKDPSWGGQGVVLARKR
jgi:SAM-dependent methyltransferase